MEENAGRNQFIENPISMNVKQFPVDTRKKNRQLGYS